MLIRAGWLPSQPCKCLWLLENSRNPPGHGVSSHTLCPAHSGWNLPALLLNLQGMLAAAGKLRGGSEEGAAGQEK